jgi:hypothetical protein
MSIGPVVAPSTIGVDEKCVMSAMKRQVSTGQLIRRYIGFKT